VRTGTRRRRALAGQVVTGAELPPAAANAANAANAATTSERAALSQPRRRAGAAR